MPPLGVHAAFYLSAHTCGCFHVLLASDKLGALPRERWSPREPPACLPDSQVKRGSKSRSSLRLAPGQPAHGWGARGLLSLSLPLPPCFSLSHPQKRSSRKPLDLSPAASMPRAYLWLSAQHLGREFHEGRAVGSFQRGGPESLGKDLSDCFPPPVPHLSAPLSSSRCALEPGLSGLTRGPTAQSSSHGSLCACQLGVLVPGHRNRLWLLHQVGKAGCRKGVCWIPGSLRSKVQAVSRGPAGSQEHSHSPASQATSEGPPALAQPARALDSSVGTVSLGVLGNRTFVPLLQPSPE